MDSLSAGKLFFDHTASTAELCQMTLQSAAPEDIGNEYRWAARFVVSFRIIR